MERDPLQKDKKKWGEGGGRNSRRPSVTPHTSRQLPGCLPTDGRSVRLYLLVNISDKNRGIFHSLPPACLKSPDQIPNNHTFAKITEVGRKVRHNRDILFLYSVQLLDRALGCAFMIYHITILLKQARMFSSVDQENI